MRKNTTPLEADEQIAFHDWLVAKDLKHTHISNGAWTPSWKTRGRLKRMGLSSGVPDLMIIIPAKRCRLGKAVLCFVEMKRVHGSRTSPEQREWKEALEEVTNVGVTVCRGAEEAIKSINSMLK